MLHQPDEERQVGFPYPLLIEGQDVGAVGGMEKEVRVLDALGDALEHQRRADVEAGEEGLQLGVGDVGVDGHGAVIGEGAAQVKSCG